MVNDVPLEVFILVVLTIVGLGLKVFYQRLKINELKERVRELKRERKFGPKKEVSND